MPQETPTNSPTPEANAPAAPASPEPAAPAEENQPAPCQPAEPNPCAPAEPGGEPLILGKFKSQEDLQTAYKELETRQRTSKEELRNEVLKEINEKQEQPPETYEVPEGLDPELAAENPQYEGFAKYAKEQGFTQQQFNDAISFYAQSVAAKAPDPAAEKKALGENADARIDAVENFVSTAFSEEEWNALSPIASTAKGIEVLEKIMGLTQTKVAQGEPNASAESKDEMLVRAKRMQNDPRYYSQRDRDPAYVKEVDELFRKAVG